MKSIILYGYQRSYLPIDESGSESKIDGELQLFNTKEERDKYYNEEISRVKDKMVKSVSEAWSDWYPDSDTDPAPKDFKELVGYISSNETEDEFWVYFDREDFEDIYDGYREYRCWKIRREIIDPNEQMIFDMAHTCGREEE